MRTHLGLKTHLGSRTHLPFARRPEGTRLEIIEMEEELWPSLQRPDCAWDGSRAKWLKRLNRAETADAQVQS